MSFLFLALGFLAALAPVSGAVPFVIEAGEDVSPQFPGAPHLQSFAWAQWDGKWIFISGRTGGYHGVGGAEADFPRKGANTKIWVVDPSGTGPARTYSLAVESLPASLDAVKDQWTSSNVLFFQDHDTLYVAGGYGQNSQGAWVTYPILSSVHLPELVDGVIHGRDTFSKSIAYSTSPLVQVAGGDLLKLDDGMFYVVGGHVFMGTYRDFEGAEEKNSPSVSQQYTGEIRKLKFERDAQGHLSVSLIERYKDPEFARRDLNAALTIEPDGHSLGAAVYGGVFTKDQLNFSKPIFWNASHAPAVDQFEQKMSAYACAKLMLFDPDSRTMYTTFFGGISRWRWNYDARQFQIAPLVGDKTKSAYFDGMEWIDHISTLARGPHEIHEYVEPDHRLAAYVGSNAVFIPAAGLQKVREDADVLDIRPLKGKRVLVGYIYGGIRAFPKEFPYHDESPAYSAGNVPTKPNDMIIAVYITAR